MGAHTSFGARDRWRLRQNRWWILAAILATLTVHGTMSVIHDNSQRHVAALLVRRSTAERIAAYASSRATILALETFAPVVAMGDGASPRETLNALVRQQFAAARCVCRDTLPATSFFTFDVASGALDVVAVLPVAGGVTRLPSSSPLAEIARRDAERPAPRSSVHVTTSRVLGDVAAVTYIPPDSSSAPRVVYGLVAPARALGSTLFASAADSTSVVDRGAPLTSLDSASLLVFGSDTTHLFGAGGIDDASRAAFNPGGPLDGINVTLALSGAQMNPAVLNIVPRHLLWHNGMLLLATVLVTIFAVGSTRRETLLARARSDFVAGVSHDLRMPLAQILLASETLVQHRDIGEPERFGLASAIVRESRRLVALVENLLLFSRTGAVELKARLEPVPVDDLFAGVVESVELAADDAHQTVEVHPAASIGVLGDGRLLRQALVNLVDNALKYGAAGQSIELSADVTNDATVRLHVDDCGPGIPREERERVFAPYERLGRDQVSERTGTGLGLAVVRQIAQACGGRVWLDNRAGGGTRATIELRRATGAVPATPAVETV